jgi:hypothetical protein
LASGNFHSGDHVVVRSPEEILSTLDADGTLDGLPFMPEMLEWCGKTLRVDRRAEKTCVGIPPPAYSNRRFDAGDVVFLEELRCDGRAHDGCKRGCKIFWKEDWLRPADSTETSTHGPGGGAAALLPRLRTKADENHYFCQSTQLDEATEPFPGKQRLWMLRTAWREIRNGDRSASEILKLLARWSRRRLLHALHSDLRGDRDRTPSESLGLEPGEVVRVKSRAEIEATLDHQRSNKGLKMGDEMARCFGRQFEVRDRVDRIIDERTGEMREMRDTVTLRNIRSESMHGADLGCLCTGQLGDCPRSELMYWREIWLDRIDGTGDEPVAAAPS